MKEFSTDKVEHVLTVQNEIGESPVWISEEGRLYWTDTEQWDSKILAYDYNLTTGKAKNRRVFANVDPEDGYPDGIIVDAEGYLWNGRWGGAQIVRYTPGGEVDRKYHLPVNVGTCMAFGGENLSDLYITTAWYGMSESEKKTNPTAGDLFIIKTDVKGRLEPRFTG